MLLTVSVATCFYHCCIFSHFIAPPRFSVTRLYTDFTDTVALCFNSRTRRIPPFPTLAAFHSFQTPATFRSLHTRCLQLTTHTGRILLTKHSGAISLQTIPVAVPYFEQCVYFKGQILHLVFSEFTKRF